MGATADYKLTLALGYRTADQRVLRQHIKRGNDVTNALAGIFYLVFGQMIEYSSEVLSDLGRQFDARHYQRPSLRPTGRVAAFPAIRASR